MKKALRYGLLTVGALVFAIGLFVVVRFGSTAPPTTTDRISVRQTAVPGGTAPPRRKVSLPELVYFGTAWQFLDRKPGMPPLVLGGGYSNARVERTGDEMFFAGTVERLDLRGAVTDVVIAYGGAQNLADFIQGSSLGNGRVREEPKWAAVLLERVWNDPRYAAARIHVTGHSLGAGYAQFAGTDAIARHGLRAVEQRLRITIFGVPNWGPQSARYYHLPPHVLDGIVTGYTAQNDPVKTNGGTDRVGRSIFLPPFRGFTGLSSILNRIAAHWPTTYMSALGLPEWLSAQDKSACMTRVSDAFITGNSIDVNYGPVRRSPPQP